MNRYKKLSFFTQTPVPPISNIDEADAITSGTSGTNARSPYHHLFDILQAKLVTRLVLRRADLVDFEKLDAYQFC